VDGLDASRLLRKKRQDIEKQASGTRADDDGVPSELAATYYSQRASAGLIVTEATQISPMGKGYANTPGIHSPEQTRAWSRIVEPVHNSGGRIFLQLWHVGRISHTSLLPDNVQPVAPSAIRANAHTHIATGSAQVSEPVALTASGIKETLADYRLAAANAKEAGFDGVEIHAANGYLIDQFLRTGTNHRTDAYGGIASNRVRFLSEVVEEVLKAWDSKQVGVRISPTVDFNDMHDDSPDETFSVAVARLNQFGLGYLHVVERAQDTQGSGEKAIALSDHLRTLWKGLYVVNGGYDGPMGEEALRTVELGMNAVIADAPDSPLPGRRCRASLELRLPTRNGASPPLGLPGTSRRRNQFQTN